MSDVDLNRISIASPCTADWDAMQGDDQVRFCNLCELNVYNLSEMSRPQAEAFVRESEGRACVRLYKRRDGTLITQDCPVGLRAALRRKLSWLAGIAASLLATLGGVFAGARTSEGSTAARPLPVISMGSPMPLPTETCELSPTEPLPISEPVAVEPVLEPEPTWEMGDMVCEPPLAEPDEVEEPEAVDHEDEPRKIMGKMIQVR